MSFERAKVLMNKGLSRPTMFVVDIPAIRTPANDYLMFYCKSARVPETNHETITVSGQGRVGVTRQQPSMVTFGKPMTITVIERTDYVVHKAMQEWFQKTSPSYNSLGSDNQRMAFYDTFAMDMMLHKLEISQEGWNSNKVNRQISKGKSGYGGYDVPFTVTFKNAYPTTIGDISYDTEASNSMLTYDISFNYETYHIEYESNK